MQKIVELLIRYKAFLLFLILEAFCLSWVVSYNPYQRASYLQSTNYVSASLYTFTSGITDYFNLKGSNDELLVQNAELQADLEIQRLEALRYKQLLEEQKLLQPYLTKLDTIGDSLFLVAKSINPTYDTTLLSNSTDQQYEFVSARIIKNDYKKAENYLLIDKGSNDGVKKNMGVIGPKGVIGVVVSSCHKFALAASVLNTNQRIAGQLLSNHAQGSIVWKGENPQECDFENIPVHIKVKTGDTVVTSGYNSVFPANKMIGIIKSVQIQDHKWFQDIKVELATDFSTVRHVYAVRNVDKDTVNLLLNQVQNEY